MLKKIFLRLALGAVLFAFCVRAEAQQPKKTGRIGYLSLLSPFSSPRRESFRQGLRELGYVEGQNIVIEYKYTEELERLAEAAAELVNRRVDVIVASGPAAFAAKTITNLIPIVFVGVQDPVASGLVRSLAMPGGHITGISNLAPELGEKRLELLKEAVPKITRIAFLFTSSTPDARLELNTQTVAQSLRVQLQSLEVRDAKDFDSALEAIAKSHAQALLTSTGAIFNRHQTRIVEFAAKTRLPAMYAALEFVDAGGLMSYAPNSADQYRRAAVYVDKILKGTKPADLPVEQPKKFEFVISLKTAKQIGLTIPPNVLARADKVIK
jgi:putative ABC transport system substrate-binding protein